MNIAVPILPSSDLTIAKQFYVEALGFRVIFESSEDGITGLIGLERDGMRINIDSPMDGHGRNACVGLEVADIVALHAEWSQNVELPHAPREEPWGAHTFELQDPDDNTIFVLQWTQS